ncbi:hypothetical protein AAIR98_000917 [Elusimicrobium simillimum]|uniref:hypothetical protein n=1 Tax=Elusimicrobium simillimum TaxID=3143438 RepID=UPI003C704531
MPKIDRKNQKQFAGAANPIDNIAVFGSLAAQNPAFSNNPDEIQSLDAFLNGWLEAIVGDKNPTMEDMNALFYLAFYQLSYLFQQGIAEYDANTTYYMGSMVSISNQTTGLPALYYSKINENLGNNPASDTTSWGGLADTFADIFLKKAGDGMMGTLTFPAVLASKITFFMQANKSIRLQEGGNGFLDFLVDGLTTGLYIGPDGSVGKRTVGVRAEFLTAGSGGLAKDYVTSYSTTTNYWYRIWNSGFKECGVAVGAGTTAVTWPVTFSDTLYTVAANNVGGSTVGSQATINYMSGFYGAGTKSTTGFTRIGSTDGLNQHVTYYAAGY